MTRVERRGSRRRVKRLQVRFWDKGKDAGTVTGYTRNFSATGVFVCTDDPFARGTRVGLEIIDGDTHLMFEGVVARRIRIDPELRKLGESGMGIRFLRPEELVREFRVRPPTTAESEAVYPVHFESPREFLETFVQDVASGGLFVRTASPAALNAVVTVELHPPDSDDGPVRIPARVVRRIESGSSRDQDEPGMGVAFIDPAGAVRSFKTHIDRLRK